MQTFGLTPAYVPPMVAQDLQTYGNAPQWGHMIGAPVNDEPVAYLAPVDREFGKGHYEVMRALLEHILATLEPSLTTHLQTLVGLVSSWMSRPPLPHSPSRYLDASKAKKLHVTEHVELCAHLAKTIFERLDPEQTEAYTGLLSITGVGVGPVGRDSLSRSTRCLLTPIGRIPFG